MNPSMIIGIDEIQIIKYKTNKTSIFLCNFWSVRWEVDSYAQHDIKIGKYFEFKYNCQFNS